MKQENWFERQDRILKIVSTKDYWDWLIDFVNKNGAFSDDDFHYNQEIGEKNKEYCSYLSYFFDYISSLSKEQNVFPNPDEEDIFYFFKLNNCYYHIGTIVGQGAYTSIYKLEKEPPIAYVILDEEITPTLLEEREMVFPIFFNKDFETNTKSKFLAIGQLTSLYIKDIGDFNKLNEFDLWVRDLEPNFQFFECDNETFEKICETRQNVLANEFALTLGLMSKKQIFDFVKNYKKITQLFV